MFRSVISAALMLGTTALLSAGGDMRSIGGESEVFIGAEGPLAMVQGSSFWDVNHEGSGPAFGVRLGAQNENWRSMVVLDYFDSEDDDQNYERGTIQVDHFLFNNQFDTVAFRPYIGANVGYLNYESMTADESGMTYGGQVGFTAGVSNSVDLDVAFKYSIAAPEELDHIGNLVFGVNYLY